MEVARAEASTLTRLLPTRMVIRKFWGSVAHRVSPARVSRPLETRRDSSRVTGNDVSAVSEPEKKPEPNRHRMIPTISRSTGSPGFLHSGIVARIAPQCQKGQGRRGEREKGGKGEREIHSRAAEVSGFASGYAVTGPVRRRCHRFTLVGCPFTHGGIAIRANNGEGGSSREVRWERRDRSNAQ